MCSPFKLALFRCLFCPAEMSVSLGFAQSSTSNAPTTLTPDAVVSAPGTASADASSNLTQLRAMIDRGRSDDALKQLDALAAKQPATAGVNRLRGLALYSENDFTDADVAFASALKQD